MERFNFNRPRNWTINPAAWIADQKSYRETADLGENGYLELVPEGNSVSLYYVSRHSGDRLIYGEYVSHHHAKYSAAQGFPILRNPKSEAA